MSDTGRQSFTGNASSALNTDSQKTTAEPFGDSFKGTLATAASAFQPRDEKWTFQQGGDGFSGNSNEGSGSLVDQVKNAVGMGGNRA